MKNIFLQKNKGYTLLFAVLVSSVVLGIGISILNISRKEFLIATSARDSSEAFYSADSGLECAIYLDDSGAFATDADHTGEVGWFKCAVPYGGVTATISSPADQQGTFVFHMRSGSRNLTIGTPTVTQDIGKSCAVVTVTKKLVTVAGVQVLKTVIDSRGYNTGWNPDSNPALALSNGTCVLPSAKRVERGVSYAY